MYDLLMRLFIFTIFTGFISSSPFLGGCYWFWFYERILVDATAFCHTLVTSIGAQYHYPLTHSSPLVSLTLTPSLRLSFCAHLLTEKLAGYGTEYKRSESTTVVEGRRSSDVWSLKGVAVNGKIKVDRALGLNNTRP